MRVCVFVYACLCEGVHGNWLTLARALWRLPLQDQYAKTEEFVESVKERASIEEQTSLVISSLGTLPFLVPRGRFEVEVCAS